MRHARRFQNLERHAAGVGPTAAGEFAELERLIDAGRDTIKTGWRWLAFGRYCALYCLADGDGDAAELTASLLNFERQIAEIENMHPNARMGAEKHLIDAGLFDAAELDRLEAWRLKLGPIENPPFEDWTKFARHCFGPKAVVTGRVPHPWKPGYIEITGDGGELLGAGATWRDAYCVAWPRFNELRTKPSTAG